MKQEILNRIQALGGDISQVKGTSLAEDLSAITFNTILYEKPEDTAWSRADEEEPIYGLGEWVDAHMELYKTDKKAFYDQMIADFYRFTEEGRGQHFWTASLFTPFKEGTEDYEEWYDDFSDEEEREEYIKSYEEDLEKLITMSNKIQNGNYKPKIELKLYPEYECFLIDCIRHNF